MENVNDYEAKAKVFKAFCDGNRLMIIEHLRSGEKCACHLQEHIPISQSTLSHHMKILVESGIVEVRKDKKWSYYSISDEGKKYSIELLSALLDKSIDMDQETQVQCGCNEIRK